MKWIKRIWEDGNENEYAEHNSCQDIRSHALFSLKGDHGGNNDRKEIHERKSTGSSQKANYGNQMYK